MDKKIYTTALIFIFLISSISGELIVGDTNEDNTIVELITEPIVSGGGSIVDTNATTECGDGEFLRGDGTCQVLAGGGTFNETYNDFIVANISNRSFFWDNLDSPLDSWLSTFNITYNNYVQANISNRSYYWDELDTFNDTQFSNVGGILTAVRTWWDGLYCRLTGCEMTGNINLNSNSILNLGGLNLTQDINLRDKNWLVPTPTLGNHTANKDYVDDATSSTAFDFFFNEDTSNIPGHFNMTESDLERPESELDSVSLGTGVQSIFNWTTLIGQPEFNELRQGVYDVHLHMNVDGSGRKPVVITPKLYNISADGSSRNLLVTFETSSILLSIPTEYDLHGVLVNPIMLGDGERLNLELEATIGATGANVIVTVEMEGTTDSHLSVQTSSNAFEKIFIRRDGTNTLTGNWQVDSVANPFNINMSGNITAGFFLGDGSQLTGVSTFNATYNDYVANNISNRSYYLNTNLGEINNINETWFENVLGFLTLKSSQLLIWFDDTFSGKTTDDLSEGSTNKYNNESWNESRGRDLFLPHDINGTNINVTSIITDQIHSSDNKAFINYSEFAEGYLVVDGNGDYVNASTPTINLTGGALSLWAMLDIGTGDDGIVTEITSIGNVGTQNRFEVRKTNNNFLASGLRANGVNYNAIGSIIASDNEGKWIHLVNTFNNTHTSFYHNGVLDSIGVKGQDFSADDFRRINIGKLATADSQYFQGGVDEVMYFNRSLTTTQIVQLNNSGRNNQTINEFFTNTLVVWFPLNIDGRDFFGNHNGELIDNAFIMKESIGEAYNVKNLGIVEDLVIGGNIFGKGFMISEDGEANFNGNVDANNFMMEGVNFIMNSDSTNVFRKSVADTDVIWRANDGGTTKTVWTIDAADSAQMIFESTAKQPLFESGLRVGLDNDNNEIDNSAASTGGSATLYIGDMEIDTSIPSDERLKQNIRETSTDLNELMNLNIFDHEYNDSFYSASGTYTSLGALEIQQIYPEFIKNFTITTKESEPIIKETCVGFEDEQKCEREVIDMTKEETEDYLMIDYDMFIPKMLKWLQGLFNWNEEQDARIAELESRIIELEKPAPQL